MRLEVPISRRVVTNLIDFTDSVYIYYMYCWKGVMVYMYKQAGWGEI